MNKEVILITGTSSGMGYQTAKLAAERGHIVIASAPTAALLNNVPQNVAMKVVIDICDEQSIQQALQAIQQAGLKITCLVNNAGYAQPGPMELVDDARLRKQFDVNFFGTLAMTRAVLPLLRNNEMREQGRGRIVTMSSMLGLVSLPYQGVYAASKHAIEAAFEALRMEVRDFNVDIVLIEPGWISTAFLKTAMAQASQQWLNDPVYGASLSTYFSISTEAETAKPSGAAKIAAAMAGTPEQAAQIIVHAIEVKYPKARYPITAMAKWMPRLSRIIPTKMWDKMQTGQFTK
jgi:short-subunit dehydrogenase